MISVLKLAVNFFFLDVPILVHGGESRGFLPAFYEASNSTILHVPTGFNDDSPFVITKHPVEKNFLFHSFSESKHVYGRELSPKPDYTLVTIQGDILVFRPTNPHDIKPLELFLERMKEHRTILTDQRPLILHRNLEA